MESSARSPSSRLDESALLDDIDVISFTRRASKRFVFSEKIASFFLKDPTAKE